MRKTTVIVLAILGVAFASMLILLRTYVGYSEQERAIGGEMTRLFEPDLAPKSKVTLNWVVGKATYAGQDPTKHGLLLDAKPSEDTWKADASGAEFARRLARDALDRYGPDRPVQGVDAPLTRADGSHVRFGFGRGEDDRVLVPLPIPPDAPKPGG